MNDFGIVAAALGLRLGHPSWRKSIGDGRFRLPVTACQRGAFDVSTTSPLLATRPITSVPGTFWAWCWREPNSTGGRVIAVQSRLTDLGRYFFNHGLILKS